MVRQIAKTEPVVILIFHKHDAAHALRPQVQGRKVIIRGHRIIFSASFKHSNEARKGERPVDTGLSKFWRVDGTPKKAGNPHGI